MQSSPDGFTIFSSMKNSGGDIVDFRYEYLNDQAELMTSLSARNLPEKRISNSTQNLVGHSFLEIFPDHAELFKKFRVVATSRKMQVEKLSLPGGDGASRWDLRQSVPMPQGIAVTYRDITQEKTLIQQLEYSNRLRTRSSPPM